MSKVSSIVYTGAGHTGVFTNTLIIAEHFNKKHFRVVSIVDRLLKNDAISHSNIRVSHYTNERGKTYKMYEVDYKAFLVVVLSFTGVDADKLKGRFVDMFISQGQELKYWRDARLQLKEETKSLHDVLKPVVDKLTIDYPNSSKGIRFYSHIHNAINEVATSSTKIRRDAMLTEQLERVQELESDVVKVVEYLNEIESHSELTRWYSLSMLNAQVGKIKKLKIS